MSDVLTLVKLTKTGLQVDGPLTFNTVSTVLKSGKETINKRQGHSLILNLENVERIDSAGISLLLEWKRYSALNNKTFSLEGMQKQVISLIKTYKLQTLF